MNRQNDYFDSLDKRDRELEEIEETLQLQSEPDEFEEHVILSQINDTKLKTATNFTRNEFQYLFSIFENDIAKLQNTKGPRQKLSGQDKFFLFLTYLKSYASVNFLAVTFGLSATYLQKLFEKMIQTLAITANAKFVLKMRKEEQIANGIGFENYPEVALVLDCSVQEIPRYAGSFNDNKIFYSNKHKLYCVKKEYAHMPNGIVCFVSNYYPGSKHDFSIFLNNLNVYKSILQKQNQENEYNYIMADKGYEGASHYLPAILPKKGRILTSAEARENVRISSDRIICENYYGRMKKLWNAAGRKVKNGLKLYDETICICVSLTNYHIQEHPLRANENSISRRSSTNASQQP